MQKLTLIIFALFLVFSAQTIFAQTEVESFIKKHFEYVEQNKLDEAINELSKAIAIEPNNIRLYFFRANVYLYKSDANGVLSNVNQAINLNPLDYHDWITGAVTLLKVKKCSEALILLDTFVAKDSTNAEIYSWRFSVKGCLKDDIGAFEEITKAIELDPKNNLYRTNQAHIISRMGDSEKAFELYKRLISSLENQSKAAKDENDKVKLQRELAMSYVSRSVIYEKNGNTDAMFTDLTRAVESFSNQGISPKGFIYEIRARKYARYKMYDKAIADYTEAIKLEPTFINYFARGNIYMILEKYENAIRDFEQSLNFSPSNKSDIEEIIGLAKRKMQEKANQPK